MDLGDPRAIGLLRVISEKTRKNETSPVLYYDYDYDLEEMIGQQLLKDI